MLWAATDGEGLQWTPYAISHHHNAGEPDPGLHFTAGVNSSVFYGDMTAGQPHTDLDALEPEHFGSGGCGGGSGGATLISEAIIEDID